MSVQPAKDLPSRNFSQLLSKIDAAAFMNEQVLDYVSGHKTMLPVASAATAFGAGAGFEPEALSAAPRH